MQKNSSTKAVDSLRALLAPFCRKHGIRRLELFGSTVGEGLRAGSDVDLLATFDEMRRPPTVDLLEMAGEVEELVGRPVDFVLRKNLDQSSNPYSRRHILDTSVCVYGD